MKKFLLLIILLACAKQEDVYFGSYVGTITYRLAAFPQTTVARRTITDNGEGTVRIAWWPNVDCYTVIENGSYPINNVEMVTTYQLGPCQKNKLVFCGRGRFIGDSLIEEGVVYHFTATDTTFTLSESGTWRACLKLTK